VKRKKSAVGAAVEELEGMELGDARLVAGARALVAALERQPAASFPAAVGHRVADREAAYRLLNHLVQALGLDRENEALGECIEVWAVGGMLQTLDAGGPEAVAECVSE
jgi:hypothetical protein